MVGRQLGTHTGADGLGAAERGDQLAQGVADGFVEQRGLSVHVRPLTIKSDSVGQTRPGQKNMLMDMDTINTRNKKAHAAGMGGRGQGRRMPPGGESLSRCLLFDGRFGGDRAVGGAQVGPVDLWAHGFASHLPAGQPFDARAMLNRDAAGDPLRDGAGGDSKLASQFALASDDLCGTLDGIHGSSLVTLYRCCQAPLNHFFHATF